MFRVKFAALVAAGLLASVVSVAQAKPAVALKLSGFLVEHQLNGAEKFVPLEKSVLKSGDEIRYVVVATNNGSDLAGGLTPVGRIPAGTVYAVGSASAANAARLEFSVDGGRTWSSAPTVMVHIKSGDVVKKADPAAYTALRWVCSRPLAAKSSASFEYEVTVK